MDDLISRQDTIDMFLTKGMVTSAIYAERMPSAQPEIIHCKECKYGVQDEDERWYCRGFGCQVGDEDGSGFCADAERRTDE